ncbi:MAG: hypothetical protein HPY59_12920 [Anaerolineae bacterium]|nr:hypothetical protein [Anaerolineae bacterium]
MKIKVISAILLLFLLPSLSACAKNLNASPMPTSELTPTATQTLTTTPVQITPTVTETVTPDPTGDSSLLDPPGCKLPPEDYTLLTVNGFLLNNRTFAMLQHAEKLYGGELEITGHAITQGSYTNSEAASFGTHSGGGAVDLSVMYKGTYRVAYDEIDDLILSLRTAGFAAWLRDFDELYPGSPIHIHAIAIGDKQLSPPAVEQLTGKFGYFLGYSGIPQEDGIPKPDPHGGPLICFWMVASGYPTQSVTFQN